MKRLNQGEDFKMAAERKQTTNETEADLDASLFTEVVIAEVERNEGLIVTQGFSNLQRVLVS